MVEMKVALTIGNFDAVHRGHVSIVETARSAVGDGRVVVWSFNPSPTTFLHPEKEIERLTVFSTRRALLLEAGADEVVELIPTQELMQQTPEAFVAKSVDLISPTVLVEGEGFRFGVERSGTTSDLVRLGNEYGFDTILVPPLEISLQDHSLHRASSSLVRSLIKRGRVEDAQIVLGRPVCVTGVVQAGDQRGRAMNYPTANIGHIETLLPADGIYAGRGVLEDGSTYPAAISIGTKPTFGEHDRTCEAYLVGFHGSLQSYGWKLELFFDKWIRDQIRFDSVEQLQAAIQEDVVQTIRLLERNS
ncbi:MAG: riboflavin kinase [Phycisphaerales bacterium]|jgi:riboflavin kinase/FMN adenylyltransferase|nr:riboflavin kinase [Phycisphaerales bacterium]